MRHAKSSWGDPGLPDHERPLNGRGRRAATAVGRHLRDAGAHPDLVLCSSAIRARQTLDRLRLASSEIAIEDELYGAGPDELLARLRRIPDPVTTALLIGHNPGIEELAENLAREPRSLPVKFATGSVIELSLPRDHWNVLEPGTGTVEAVVLPRDLG